MKACSQWHVKPSDSTAGSGRTFTIMTGLNLLTSSDHNKSWIRRHAQSRRYIVLRCPPSCHRHHHRVSSPPLCYRTRRQHQTPSQVAGMTDTEVHMCDPSQQKQEAKWVMRNSPSYLLIYSFKWKSAFNVVLFWWRLWKCICVILHNRNNKPSQWWETAHRTYLFTVSNGSLLLTSFLFCFDAWLPYDHYEM